MRRMAPAQALWHQDFHLFAQQLVPFVAEQLLHLRIDDHDPSPLVDDNYGVGRGFQKPPKSGLRPLLVSDVDTRRNNVHRCLLRGR